MLPKYHIISGVIFSFLIWILFPDVGFLGFVIIFLSSILIDVDHYIYYVYNHKDWSLKNAYSLSYQKTVRWKKLKPEQKAKYKITPMIFHGIETWIPLLILSFISKFFLWIFLGVSMHLLMDLIELIYYDGPICCKISQIYLYFKNKNKKEFI